MQIEYVLIINLKYHFIKTKIAICYGNGTSYVGFGTRYNNYKLISQILEPYQFKKISKKQAIKMAWLLEEDLNKLNMEFIEWTQNQK